MEGNGIICNLKNNKLGENIFNFFLEALIELNNEKIIYIGLSGGRSFNEFYSSLLSRKNEISCWDKIRFCFVDERMVSLSSDDSNYKLVNKLLFNKLIENKLITSDQIISLNLEAKNIAKDYSIRIPKIDIAFFGSGEDGHIASLFPEHELLHSQSNQFISISDSPKPPKKRVTLSPKMINTITYSCIVFKGEGKQEAFDTFRNKKKNSSKCPAKLIMNSLNWRVVSDLK